ncbi:MAG: lipoyl(octanoyl) transferase LipB [Flavobacteriia bacterium]|jgi:lipoyl(octanoyl) transferase
MPEVECIDLGLIDYKEAWDLQEKLFQKTVQQKIDIRNGDPSIQTSNYIIFCEHPHVYTLGKSGSEENLLLSAEQLSEKEAVYYKINRGGDITYHGPGQLVVYPILDLDYFFTDIHKYMRFLEEAVISTLREFGIASGRVEGLTGVWIEGDTTRARKICAMGVKSSRWVTMHGIGFNINTDLNYFSHIIPCGIDDKAVTSMKQELGIPISMEKVIVVLKQKFAEQFSFTYSS